MFFRVKKGTVNWTQMTVGIALRWEESVGVDMTEK
jgi:hypothetical protein